MRSLAEIDADIAAVQQRIAARNEGMPLRNSPEYRAARFDYIVDGDRSGLDSYQNALNAAIQNKLSRESQKRLMDAGKQQAADEALDQWQKDYSFAKSAKEEIDNDPRSTQKQKDDAAATVRYYEAVGSKKGYMDKYLGMTKAEETPKSETPKVETHASTKSAFESFKELLAKGQTLESDEELDKYIDALLAYKGNDAVVGEAYTAIKAAQDKKQANKTMRWEVFKDNVDAELKNKDKTKLKELQNRMETEDELKSHKDSATVKQKIDSALNKKPASPVVQYINNLKPENLMGSYAKLRIAAKKSKTENAPIGERSYPYTLVYNNDGSLTVSGGGFSRHFKASDFSEESIGNEKKPDYKVNENKQGSKNSVASVLSGGGDEKKAKRGGASRRAPVTEPED